MWKPMSSLVCLRVLTVRSSAAAVETVLPVCPGPFPSEIARLPSLQLLRAFGNALTGECFFFGFLIAQYAE